MIGILAAIVLASVGTFALITYVQSAKDEAIAGEARVEVYVLSKTVPADTPVAEIKNSVVVEEIPEKVRVEGAVRDLDSLDDDLVAAVELQAGEQLLASRLVDVDELTQVDVPEGLQEVTVALDPERAIGGELAVGDTVGVVLSFDPFDTNVVPVDEMGETVTAAPAPVAQPADEEGDAGADAENPQTPNMTHLTFHKVLVTGVQFDQNDASQDATTDDATTEGEGEENPVERAPSNKLLVTLALSSPEVEQVVFAAEFGHIWLTAENAKADENGTRIVTLGEAYDPTAVTR
jgi:pilus assembly protein CpaB